MQNIMQERALAAAGELAAGFEHGRRPDGDGGLRPDAGGGVFGEQRRRRGRRRSAGCSGAEAACWARWPAASSSRKRRRACWSPTARSGVQVAAAEGSTKKADLRLGGALFGGGVGAAGGGYGNTNEGKIIAAAFMDNYNKVVSVVRNDPSLQRNVGTLKQEAAAGGTTKAGAVFSEGDVLMPKIAQRQAARRSRPIRPRPLATLARTDELVVIGAEKNGFINVQSATASGWVKIVLMQKR